MELSAWERSRFPETAKAQRVLPGLYADYVNTKTVGVDRRRASEVNGGERRRDSFAPAVADRRRESFVPGTFGRPRDVSFMEPKSISEFPPAVIEEFEEDTFSCEEEEAPPVFSFKFIPTAARGMSFAAAAAVKPTVAVAQRTRSFGSSVRRSMMSSVSSKEREVLSKETWMDFADIGSDWKQDLLAIPHNAVRRELVTFGAILGALSSKQRKATSKEIELVGGWIRTFRQFLADYFALEDGVIFFWLNVWDANLPSSLSPSERSRKRLDVMDLCADITKYHNRLQSDESTGSLAKFLAASHSLLPVLDHYFRTQEELVPSLLASVSVDQTSSEERSVRNSLFQFIRTRLCPNTFFILLTRWIDDVETLEGFEREFLSVPNLITRAIARKRFIAVKHKLMANHFSVLTTIVSSQ